MDRKPRPPRAASFDDTNELNLWKKIVTALTSLDGLHKDAEEVFTSINKLHAIADAEGITPSTSSKLSTLYAKGIEESSSETKTITEMIENLTILIALRKSPESGTDQKRKKRKSEADDLRTGTVAAGASGSSKKTKSDRTIPVGAKVAAKHGKQKDKSEEWILAIVLSFNAEKNRYHVEDVDDDNSGVRQKYMVPIKSVIPIPNESEVRLLPEIPPNQDVLALYPGTTCFYKATVVVSPSKNKDPEYLGFYKVRFEDDNNETQFVSPRDVLRVK